MALEILKFKGNVTMAGFLTKCHSRKEFHYQPTLYPILSQKRKKKNVKLCNLLPWVVRLFPVFVHYETFRRVKTISALHSFPPQSIFFMFKTPQHLVRKEKLFAQGSSTPNPSKEQGNLTLSQLTK